MPTSSFNIDALLNEYAHLLPSQGPITEFVHHNTLHAFQHLNFFEAIDTAARELGSKRLPDLPFYLERYVDGETTQADIQFVLKTIRNDKTSFSVEDVLQQSKQEPKVESSGISQASDLRTKWLREFGVDLNKMTQGICVRLVSSFLDQGLASWQMPEGRSVTFWEQLREMVSSSFLPIVPLSRSSCRKLLLEQSPQAVIKHCLRRLVPNEAMAQVYLRETVLFLRGWAGFVQQVETTPSILGTPRSIDLAQWCALLLLADIGYLESELGNEFPMLPDGLLVTDEASKASTGIPLQQVWQESFEWSHYRDLLLGLRVSKTKPKVGSTLQGVFCIDDRNCSIRRHLEELDARIETFGAPGFFGIDCYIKGDAHRELLKHAPVPVNPKHVIQESARKAQKKSIFKMIDSHFSSKSLFREWLAMFVLGFAAGWRMVTASFFPRWVEERRLRLIDTNTDLKVFRTGDGHLAEPNLMLGYTVEESAVRIEGLLRTIGLIKDFAPIVLIVAHGASTANNPYFSAYDCGACSGKPGAPNARSFCFMANHIGVRRILVDKGLVIPEGTVFVPAMFDTTADEIDFYDLDTITPEQRQDLLSWQPLLDQALARNAQERCRRFALASKGVSPERAKAHVETRAVAIYEVRPEYNHASNFSCIVGKRDHTRGLFLDRRAFLQSYNPESDPQGTVLKGILNAVIPVCGGINLEYLFSRIDPEVYGSGSKLPQNVVGLFGVMTGIQSDLRTGLPYQMTEIHDPIRLLLVVEQKHELVLKVLNECPHLLEWIDNQWIWFVTYDASSQEFYLYTDKKFQRLDLGYDRTIATAPSSADVVANKRGHVPVHLLKDCMEC